MLHRLKRFYDFFLLQKLNFSRYEIGLLVFIALCFAISARLYYPSEIMDNKHFTYKDTPIINSSDGFWYAKGALDRIVEPEIANPQSPTSKSVSIITEFIYNITPFSFEEVIFFIPLLSSMIVIPLVLIGKEMGNPLLGFSVALASSVAGGFYVRTIAGYYDDDFFTLTLPFLLLYFMVAVMNRDPSHTLRTTAFHHSERSSCHPERSEGSMWSVLLGKLRSRMLHRDPSHSLRMTEGEAQVTGGEAQDDYSSVTLSETKSLFGKSVEILRDTTLIFGITTIFFYHWWYQNGPIIITGLLATMFFVTLLFYRRNEKAWMFMVLGFMANLKVAFLLKLLPVVIIYIAWKVVKAKRSDKLKWFYAVAFIIAGALFINSGLFVELAMKFDSYISKDMTDAVKSTSGYGLNYFNSLHTVQESKAISFEQFFKMIAWEEWIFLFGTVGYFLASLRYPFLWVAFPLYFIGLSAADAGMRFTPYGSPVVFLGAGYLVYLLGDIVSRVYKLKLLYPIIGFTLMLYPLQASYEYIKSTLPSSAFSGKEAASLSMMKYIADRKDYIVSWWDFGYPVRYYADVRTHSDGGSQSGNVSYMESLALSSTSQALAYNLLRDGIEIREARLGGEGTFGAIMKHSKEGETPKASEMIEKLKNSEYETYDKTRNIYWMMMHRMLPIFYTIRQFSDYDLQTNAMTNFGVYMYSPFGEDTPSELKMAEGVVFDKERSIIKLPDGKVAKVKEVIKVYEENKTVRTEKFPIHQDGFLYLIQMVNTGGYIVVDSTVLNSNFIQMFVFNNYDSKYFEPVMTNPLMKVYRLKGGGD